MHFKVVHKFWLLFPLLFFLPFAVALKWLPSFIEEYAFIGPTLQEKTQTIEMLINKLESNDEIDKKGLIKIFKSQTILEENKEDFFHIIIKIIDSFAGAFLGGMLIYLSSILFIYQAMFKKKPLSQL